MTLEQIEKKRIETLKKVKLVIDSMCGESVSSVDFESWVKLIDRCQHKMTQIDRAFALLSAYGSTKEITFSNNNRNQNAVQLAAKMLNSR